MAPARAGIAAAEPALAPPAAQLEPAHESRLRALPLAKRRSRSAVGGRPVIDELVDEFGVDAAHAALQSTSFMSDSELASIMAAGHHLERNWSECSWGGGQFLSEDEAAQEMMLRDAYLRLNDNVNSEASFGIDSTSCAMPEASHPVESIFAHQHQHAPLGCAASEGFSTGAPMTVGGWPPSASAGSGSQCSRGLQHPADGEHSESDDTEATIVNRATRASDGRNFPCAPQQTPCSNSVPVADAWRQHQFRAYACEPRVDRGWSGKGTTGPETHESRGLYPRCAASGPEVELYQAQFVSGSSQPIAFVGGAHAQGSSQSTPMSAHLGQQYSQGACTPAALLSTREHVPHSSQMVASRPPLGDASQVRPLPSAIAGETKLGGHAEQPEQNDSIGSAPLLNQRLMMLRQSGAQQPRSAALVKMAHDAAIAAAAASAASALSGRRSSRPHLGAHVAAAAAAAAASRLIHAEAEASGSGRGSLRSSSINRRAWSAEEDQTIRECVAQMGMRWRLIAPLLPGRSDDSVRNRWKRLKEEDGEPVDDSGADDDKSEVRQTRVNRVADGKKQKTSHDSKKHVKGGTGNKVADGDGEEAGQRVSWSSYEDQVIVRAVEELGPRWCAVAARLPSRTDQAVRNRWNRLQQRARVQARTMLATYSDRPMFGFGGAGPTNMSVSSCG